jgi:TonB family protein
MPFVTTDKSNDEPPVKTKIPEPPGIIIDENWKHNTKEAISQNIKGANEIDKDSMFAEFPTFENNPVSGSKPGDGIGTEYGGTDIDLAITISNGKTDLELPAEPKERPEWFQPDIPPSVDLDELRREIVYPEIARKIGVGGKVVVKVWINETGRPENPQVLKSDSKLLEEEALRVIMLLVCTPAINNSKPVGCWIVIPIHFELTE